MKKYILKITVLSLCFITFFASCVDDDKTNALQTIENAAIVIFFIDNENINIGPTDTTDFSADVDAHPDVETYNLRVVRKSGGVVSDTLNFNSYTQQDFPFSLTIGTQELANTFSLQEADVLEGDSYEFYGSTVDTDGTIYTIKNFTDGNGFIPSTGSIRFNSDGYRFDVDILDE